MGQVKHLKADIIEEMAINELRRFDSKILDKPNPSCILKYTIQLCAEHDMKLEFQNLGEVNTGKVLGLFVPNPLAIYIDASISDDLRRNFVLAHEVGHFILHRDVIIRMDEYFEPADTKYDLEYKLPQTDKEWVEYQANTFASRFLMPTQTFIKAFIYAQKEIGIHQNLGKIILIDEEYSWRDLQTIKTMLSELYQVTKTSVEYRLNSLGLIENNSRFKDSADYYNHIADKLGPNAF